MALTSRLNKAVYEVHLLRNTIHSQIQNNSVFHNEVERILKYTIDLYSKTTAMDDLIRMSRPGSVPTDKIEQLDIEMTMILSHVGFIKQQLDIHMQHEKMNASMHMQQQHKYQHSPFYSSSDEQTSPVRRNEKTPEKENSTPAVPAIRGRGAFNSPESSDSDASSHYSRRSSNTSGSGASYNDSDIDSDV